MSNWKSIALVAIGFNIGMIYTTACSTDGKSSLDAEADPGEDCTTDDCDDGSDDTDDFNEPGDDTDDNQNGGVTPAELAALAADLATLQSDFVTLQAEHASLQASVDCWVGHHIDDQRWYDYGPEHDDYPGEWKTMVEEGISGDALQWEQGPNSDAVQAYNDCF